MAHEHRIEKRPVFAVPIKCGLSAPGQLSSQELQGVAAVGLDVPGGLTMGFPRTVSLSQETVKPIRACPQLDPAVLHDRNT
jgi:hypothetical protein